MPNKYSGYSVLQKFGNNVRMRRLKLKMSQEELAKKAGLHRTYIGSIERSERNVSLVNIERLSTALEVPIKILVNGERKRRSLRG